MKSLAKLLLVICLGLANNSCGPGIELAELSFDDRRYNSLVVDRVPKYGDGNPDGCIVEPQISLAMNPNGDNEIQGITMDVKTKEPLTSAYIWLFAEDTSYITSDLSGKFQIPRVPTYYRIEVQYIGYRTLVIDLSKKDLLH